MTTYMTDDDRLRYSIEHYVFHLADHVPAPHACTDAEIAYRTVAESLQIAVSDYYGPGSRALQNACSEVLAAKSRFQHNLDGCNDNRRAAHWQYCINACDDIAHRLAEVK